METDNEPVDIPPPPHRTWPITVAGWLWVVSGRAFYVIPTLFVLSLLFEQSTGPSPCFIYGFFCFSAFFAPVGKRTLSGAAEDTLFSGNCSIFLGLLYSTTGMYVINEVYYSMSHDISMVCGLLAGILNAALGSSMLFAGILAITARADYHAWRGTLPKQIEE